MRQRGSFAAAGLGLAGGILITFLLGRPGSQPYFETLPLYVLFLASTVLPTLAFFRGPRSPASLVALLVLGYHVAALLTARFFGVALEPWAVFALPLACLALSVHPAATRIVRAIGTVGAGAVTLAAVAYAVFDWNPPDYVGLVRTFHVILILLALLNFGACYSTWRELGDKAPGAAGRPERI